MRDIHIKNYFLLDMNDCHIKERNSWLLYGCALIKFPVETQSLATTRRHFLAVYEFHCLAVINPKQHWHFVFSQQTRKNFRRGCFHLLFSVDCLKCSFFFLFSFFNEQRTLKNVKIMTNEKVNQFCYATFSFHEKLIDRKKKDSNEKYNTRRWEKYVFFFLCPHLITWDMVE